MLRGYSLRARSVRLYEVWLYEVCDLVSLSNRFLVVFLFNPSGVVGEGWVIASLGATQGYCSSSLSGLLAAPG